MRVERPVNVAGNLKVGNMSIGFTDISSNVSGIPLTVTRNYDSRNLQSLTTAEGIVEKAAYNQLNLVTGISLDGNELTAFDYDTKGNLTDMEDSLGNSTKLSYEKDGKLKGIADDIGMIQSLTYDENGNPVSMTDGNGNNTRYSYNADGVCTGVTVKRTDSDGIQREYTSV